MPYAARRYDLPAAKFPAHRFTVTSFVPESCATQHAKRTQAMFLDFHEKSAENWYVNSRKTLHTGKRVWNGMPILSGGSILWRQCCLSCKAVFA
eukprot:4689959-Amphidinium_carterae.1